MRRAGSTLNFPAPPLRSARSAAAGSSVGRQAASFARPVGALAGITARFGNARESGYSRDVPAENVSSMNAPPNRNADVLIVGAGPTGLVLALWLARLGVRIRIVDKTDGPGTTSRALAVQSRTLEFYAQVGLANAVVQRGREVRALNLWVAGRKAAHVAFADMGEGMSPFPKPLIFPQDEHERLLVERLAAAGIEVERRTELLDFNDANGRVIARLRRPDGSVETCEAAYIAGCDGAHSTVRGALGIGFPGGTYEHVFYVADVDARGAPVNGELHVGLDKADFLAVFPLKDDKRVRLVGTVRGEDAQQSGELSWDDVSRRVIEWMHIDVAHVNWFSTYHVHHRVAERFRAGRAFLLGDAAHVHSPVGGQGMNTGIGDAVNLAWKLAAVLQARADESILDTYEPERIAFARRLVTTTDKAFTSVTSSSLLARIIRLHVVPVVLPLLFAIGAFRRLMFRTVSQIAVNYRGSRLSEGVAGSVRGGDRLPWISAAAGEDDNFAPLTSIDWQVHVYGEAHDALRAACDARKLALHVFVWRPGMQSAGLQRNAAYLVRPDGYIAVADATGTDSAIMSYMTARGIVANGLASVSRLSAVAAREDAKPLGHPRTL